MCEGSKHIESGGLPGRSGWMQRGDFDNSGRRNEWENHGIDLFTIGL